MAIDEYGNEIPTSSSVLDSSATQGSTLSQEAQDAATAAGVGFNQVKTSEENREPPEFATYDAEATGQQLDENINFKNSQSYIDDAKSTVAGQLNSLLSTSNPYIQQNQKLAEETAGAKGLKNTTMSVLAGREAAINAALPIAQQDAQTYATFAGKQADAEYNQETIQGEAIVSGQMNIQAAEISDTHQNISNQFNALLTGASEQSKIFLTDVQGSYNKAITELETASNHLLQQMQLDYATQESAASNVSGLLQNFQITVENLLSNPELLTFGADAINSAIDESRKLTSNAIMTTGATYGIDLTDIVEEYLSAPADMADLPEETEEE